MNAPATAPIGPSTTAPDTAPSAASPARCCADAAEVAITEHGGCDDGLDHGAVPHDRGQADPALWPQREAFGVRMRPDSAGRVSGIGWPRRSQQAICGDPIGRNRMRSLSSALVEFAPRRADGDPPERRSRTGRGRSAERPAQDGGISAPESERKGSAAGRRRIPAVGVARHHAISGRSIAGTGSLSLETSRRAPTSTAGCSGRPITSRRQSASSAGNASRRKWSAVPAPPIRSKSNAARRC